jgi:hypothetical protein
VILSSKKDFLENKSIFDFTGVYILVDSLQEREPELYIGKGRVKERLTNHEIKKEFWNNVFAIRLKTEEGFNESHTSYLEHYFIKTSIEINRSISKENKQKPREPKLEESIICELTDYIETIKTLVSTLGLKVFEPLASNKSERKKSEIFVCKSENFGCYAEGEFTPDGFIVFKGAKLRINGTESFKNRAEEKLRKKLLDQGLVKKSSDNLYYELSENYDFGSPSTAGAVVLSRATNGWTAWKRKSDNKTLDEVYRDKE